MHSIKIDEIKRKQKSKLKKLQRLVIKFDKLGVKPTNQTFTLKEREEWTLFKKDLISCSAMVNGFIIKWEKKIQNTIFQLDSGGSDEKDQIFQATQEMAEMNMEYNQMYLEIQGKMQNDNPKFTLMSNLAKVKYDTARNAINEVR